MKKYRIKETGVILEKPTGLHCYYIGAIGYKPEDIKDLGLTIEEIKPEVKKLFAYWNNGEIKFFNLSRGEDYHDEVGNLWTYVTKYDIEYPVGDDK